MEWERPFWPVDSPLSTASSEYDITKIMGVVGVGRRARGVPQAAPISRFLRGLAASRSHSNASASSRGVAALRSPRSRSTSSTAHANTYSSSCSASSSDRATTSSFSLSSNSAARCRATQSHCRHRPEQNSRGRPGTGPLGQRSATPSAVIGRRSSAVVAHRVFRHDDIVPTPSVRDGDLAGRLPA